MGAMATTHPDTAVERQNPLIKLALEFGPLACFFIANQRGGIFTATAVFMVAVVVSLALSYWITRRIPIVPLISVAVVLVFGGLTLWLNNELFIKLKPTIVNTMFGFILLGGLLMGKPLLTYVLDSVVTLTDEGWRKLTFRWAMFFFVLALLNELVWRTQTTDFWVNFKVFGIMPLTMAFALLQTPLILKHQVEETAAAATGDGAGRD
jgi:intracellular septation protein